MQPTSLAFYFLLMALFLGESALLGSLLPLQRRLVEQDRQGQRLVTVDGLRGLLALSVFLHHSALYYYAHGGAGAVIPSNFYAQMGVLPVTLFFFITGYLFWTKLGRRQSIPFVPFMRDRLRRLAPVYCLACVLFFLLVAQAAHYERQVSWARLAGEAAAWLSFVGAGHDMNGVKDSRWWLGQVWTLRLEWFFYLSLPFLGWFARRRARLPLLLAGAAVLSLVVAHSSWPGPAAGPANYLWKTLGWFALSVASTFSVGMLVAVLPRRDRVTAWARSSAATVISLSLIGITALWAPAQYGWLESALLAVPFACVCLGNSWFGLLRSTGACSLGRVSYSFYLLHAFTLHVGLMLLLRVVPFSQLTPVRYWAFAAACGTVAVLVSYVTYQVLEHPFLDSARPAARLARGTQPFAEPAQDHRTPHGGLRSNARVAHPVHDGGSHAGNLPGLDPLS
ncbi:MAG TPA: acyltransferase [Acidobacteriaceae bacterium]